MPKPLKAFRCGRVCAAIFEDTVEKDGQTFGAYNVRIQRICGDDEDVENINSFRDTDLPHVILVVQKAYEELALREMIPTKTNDR